MMAILQRIGHVGETPEADEAANNEGNKTIHVKVSYHIPQTSPPSHYPPVFLLFVGTYCVKPPLSYSTFVIPRCPQLGHKTGALVDPSAVNGIPYDPSG